MKKTLIIVVLSIILVSALGFYFLSNSKGEEEINSSLNIDECDKIYDAISKANCYTNVAITNKDISICSKYENSIPYCFGDVAAAKKDISICDNLQNIYKKYNCYLKVAVAKEDFSVCSKIIYTDNIDTGSAYNTYAPACYQKVAEKKKIVTECNDVPQQYKDFCYLGIAINTSNVSICDNIGGSSEKSSCYIAIATQTKNSDLCEREEVIAKDTCRLNAQ